MLPLAEEMLDGLRKKFTPEIQRLIESGKVTKINYESIVGRRSGNRVKDRLVLFFDEDLTK